MRMPFHVSLRQINKENSEIEPRKISLAREAKALIEYFNVPSSIPRREMKTESKGENRLTLLFQFGLKQ